MIEGIKEEIKQDKFQLVKVKTNKNADAYIQNSEYYFWFERLNKDESKLFRCKEYKKNSKCPAFFKLKGDEIIEKNLLHNHEANEKECSKYII